MPYDECPKTTCGAQTSEYAHKNIKKVLKKSREVIEAVVVNVLPEWEKELDQSGMYRIFDREGNCFWVSRWYYDKCAQVNDKNGNRMYWNRSGWEVEVGSRSPRGFALSAVRKLQEGKTEPDWSDNSNSSSSPQKSEEKTTTSTAKKESKKESQ